MNEFQSSFHDSELESDSWDSIDKIAEDNF